jgi:ATP-dependent Clp protease, protease subunit
MNIYLTGEIELVMIPRVTKELLIAWEENVEDVAIFISSNGGDAYAGLGLYDVISQYTKLGVNIQTVAIGSCSSAALLPFLAGNKRTISRHTTVTTHPMRLSNDEFEDAKSWRDKAVHLQGMSDKMVAIFVKETNGLAGFWEDFLAIERHSDGEGAVELGIATDLL